MKILSKLFSLPVIVLLAWMGANVYQDNDLFTNPFVKQSILDKIERSNTDLAEDEVESATEAAKDSFKKGINNVGDALKEIAE